ncbi:DegT/DnrJ/EryC1/StrS family aminotransferase [Dokdonia sp.]|uniref:DegT/DnrJ/EryC1/StrS family aminotransferase n=1 Tax=Dokdonia sp. TaxID=2024995 RepID=UPI00326747F2
MSETKIWLSSPHMGGTEQNYVNLAFDTNWIAPLGPNVSGFENDLSTYLNNTPVAALSSGTAALHLALLQCGVGLSDEVICQSFTFSASANPITYLGAKPIFVDSETSTWNISPTYLEEAIVDRIAKGKKPKAIVAVHLYGMPYLVDEVHAVANKYEIPVVEDSAEALGSTYKGKNCGTFGDYGVLSFNGNKIITTSGGGALICPSEEAKKHTIFLATQARDDAPHYQHSTIGYNYRLSNISAGIGRGQMEVLDKHINLRREMNTFYQELFKGYDGITVFKEPTEDFYCNNWLSAILVDPEKTNGVTREDIRLAFAKANIESRPLWKPMHMQPVFENCAFYGEKVAFRLFENGLCLPSGSNLTFEDRQRIEKVIFAILSR